MCLCVCMRAFCVFCVRVLSLCVYDHVYFSVCRTSVHAHIHTHTHTHAHTYIQSQDLNRQITPRDTKITAKKEKVMKMDAKLEQFHKGVCACVCMCVYVCACVYVCMCVYDGHRCIFQCAYSLLLLQTHTHTHATHTYVLRKWAVFE